MSTTPMDDFTDLLTRTYTMLSHYVFCKKSENIAAELNYRKIMRAFGSKYNTFTIQGKNPWIPCTEKLPIECGRYVVYGNCTGTGEMEDIAEFTTTGSIGYFRTENQPTHWKYLSTPPKEKV